MSEHLYESNKTATLRWFGGWERGNRSQVLGSILLDARKMAKFAQAGEGDEAGMWTKPCSKALPKHKKLVWKSTDQELEPNVKESVHDDGV